MDYTNLVKTYYRLLYSKLNKYTVYFGSIVEGNDLEVEDSSVFKKIPNFLALSDYDLNINANSKDYEAFLDYYANTLPDLYLLFLGKKGILALYESLLDNKILNDDEGIIEFLNAYIDSCIETYAESKVIA